MAPEGADGSVMKQAGCTASLAYADLCKESAELPWTSGSQSSQSIHQPVVNLFMMHEDFDIRGPQHSQHACQAGEFKPGQLDGKLRQADPREPQGSEYACLLARPILAYAQLHRLPRQLRRRLARCNTFPETCCRPTGQYGQGSQDDAAAITTQGAGL